MLIRGTGWLVAAAMMALGPAAAGQEPHTTVVRAWTFNRQGDVQGWMLGQGIWGPVARTDGLHFETVGSDPIMIAPPFEPFGASDRQYVAIDIAGEGGTAELFYTNKTEGRYGGFEPHWMTPIVIPPVDNPQQARTVYAYPFWSALGRIVKLRFDPPSDVKCRLVAIRVLEDHVPPSETLQWNFTQPGPNTWRPLFGLQTRSAPGGLELADASGQGRLMTPVQPFDAASRPVVTIEVEGAASVTFCWSGREYPGIRSVGVPVRVDKERGSRQVACVDLRGHPVWKGEVMAIGVGPTDGSMRLRAIEIKEAPDSNPLVPRFLGMVLPVNRADRPFDARLVVENLSDQPSPACEVEFCIAREPLAPNGLPTTADDSTWELARRAMLEAVEAGKRSTASVKLPGHPAGRYQLAARLLTPDGKPASEFVYDVVRIDPAIATARAPYVPEPRPARSDYEIGVYYFPGWSPGADDRWRHQVNYPERDPVLGYYREGEPEVADWHVKWAVENGIRFFIYDWYWRDGKVELETGLHEGLLKARYGDMVRFCVMWANHPPFASHTPEQMLQVTDYWIEHYFRRPNYYRVEGRLYVSFFSVEELPKELGSDEKVREVFDAMRKKVHETGLGDLYLVACGPAGKSSQERYKRLGFDAVTAYNYPGAGAAAMESPYGPFIRAHEPIWRAAHQAGVLRYIPLLTSNWDARPWHGTKSAVRYGRSTGAFQDGLRRMKAFLDSTGGRIGIIEAWNEWGEGSFIEPNIEFGFGDLEAIRRVFGRPGDWPMNRAPSDVGLGPYHTRR